MKFQFRIRPFLLFALIALLSTTAIARSAEQYAVGGVVAPFSAHDQFGAPFKLGADCRALLISFDMATGKQANLKLSALGKDFLPKHQAIYVADIHGMPAIGRTFALPKMRSYTHRIVLPDSDALLAPFPRQGKRVTVLLLRSGKITAIRYWDPEKEDVNSILGSRR